MGEKFKIICKTLQPTKGFNKQSEEVVKLEDTLHTEPQGEQRTNNVKLTQSNSNTCTCLQTKYGESVLKITNFMVYACLSKS